MLDMLSHNGSTALLSHLNIADSMTTTVRCVIVYGDE